MARVRITHVENFKVFAPAARPSFAWREGLRGGPVDGLVGVLCLRTDEGVAGVAVAQNRASAVDLEDLVGRLLREELVGIDPLEREDDDEEEGYVARIYATRAQVRAMAARGVEAVAGGRPPCPLCDMPMDPAGHVCPRWN